MNVKYVTNHMQSGRISLLTPRRMLNYYFIMSYR